MSTKFSAVDKPYALSEKPLTVDLTADEDRKPCNCFVCKGLKKKSA